MSNTNEPEKRRTEVERGEERKILIGPIDPNETIVESYLVSNGQELNLISYHRYWRRDDDPEAES
jgi:hypothetical protein